MTGLPQGWTLARLDEVTNPRGEKADPSSLGDLPFLGMDHIEAHSANLIGSQPVNELKSAVAVFKSGDLLYGRLRPYLNKVHLAEFDGAASAEFIVFPPKPAIEQRFLQCVLRSSEYRTIADQRSTGDRPRIKFENVGNYEIPLPPLPEQRRIVSKLDALSARSSTVSTHLNAINKLVERYKAGVLGLELSGVPYGNKTDNTNIQPIPNDNERGTWAFDALPAHWTWINFKAFLVNRTDNCRKLPQKDYQSQGPYPVIDQGAELIGGYCEDSQLLLPADPPYIIFGDHTRCVKFFDAPFVQGADGVKVFHAGKDVDIRFAYWALKSLKLPNKGYSRHAKFLKETFFPLPPFNEQCEIVCRIENAFANIDRLATEAAKALKLMGQLDIRILSKAFAGELVPQDPNDEPAEVLLTRIRAAKQGSPSPRRKRRGKS